MWRIQVVEQDLLYLADAYTLLDCLQATLSSEECAGMVGHNPGISDLLHFLRRSDTRAARFEALPTLGVTQLTFTGN
tara:strand:- start:503 stop:733 length:231 start_codon:yes stop_codon:yes gene_type:complete